MSDLSETQIVGFSHAQAQMHKHRTGVVWYVNIKAFNRWLDGYFNIISINFY